MKPHAFTTDDVKDAALAYATQFDVQATRLDCSVYQYPTDLTVRDSGGVSIVRNAVYKWDVTISAKSPPNQRPGNYRVPVEYLSGGIAAMDFREL